MAGKISADYVKDCIRNYQENRARYREINIELKDVGSMNQNFSGEKGGFSPFSKFDKILMRNERLEREREEILEKIKIANAVANTDPLIHAVTRGGISVTRYADINKTTRWSARRQYDRAISHYVKKVNCK